MANGFFDTKGLFGTTPEELQRKIFDESQLRRAKEMQFLAQGTATPGYTYGMLQSIEPLRQRFENVGEDPRVTALRNQETMAKEVFSKFPQVKDANTMRQMAGELMRLGMAEQAGKLFAAASRMESGTSTDEKRIKYWEKRLNCEQYAEGSEERKQCGLDAESKALDFKRRSVEEQSQIEAEKNFRDVQKSYMDNVQAIDEGSTQASKALELLEKIDTGGFTNEVKTATERFFGTMPADKGQFNTITSRLMFANLKKYFGGVISDSERETLVKVEANLLQSKPVNDALLRDLLNIYKRQAEIAEVYLNATSFDEARKGSLKILRGVSKKGSGLPTLQVPSKQTPKPVTSTTENDFSWEDMK